MGGHSHIHGRCHWIPFTRKCVLVGEQQVHCGFMGDVTSWPPLMVTSPINSLLSHEHLQHLQWTCCQLVTSPVNPLISQEHCNICVERAGHETNRVAVALLMCHWRASLFSYSDRPPSVPYNLAICSYPKAKDSSYLFLFNLIIFCELARNNITTSIASSLYSYFVKARYYHI